MPQEFRECLTFCNAIGVPCHGFFTILIALRGSDCPIRKFVVTLNRKRRFAGKRSF
jgi:hypothetical protein